MNQTDVELIFWRLTVSQLAVFVPNESDMMNMKHTERNLTSMLLFNRKEERKQA